MNDFDNENKTAGNPYETPQEQFNEPQGDTSEPKNGAYDPQNEIFEPAPQDGLNSNGESDNMPNGFGDGDFANTDNNGNNDGYYNEGGYYVHKSNGYVPPEIKNNGYESSYKPNENPYDRQNGVFTGGGLPEQKGGNGLAIASMILGIVSLVLCCCGSYVTLVLAIAGLACGIVALTKRSSGYAIAGVITSAIGIIFGIVGIVISFNSTNIEDWFGSMGDLWEDDYLPAPPDEDSSFDHNNHAFLGNLTFYIRLFLGV